MAVLIINKKNELPFVMNSVISVTNIEDVEENQNSISQETLLPMTTYKVELLNQNGSKDIKYFELAEEDNANICY